MRRTVITLAAISTVLVSGLAFPAPAQAATLDPACIVTAAQDNDGAVLIGEHPAPKYSDASSPIITTVVTTGCPKVKTTKVTIVLPGRDLSGSSKDGKQVSIRVRHSAIKAAKAKVGTDYKVKTKVTFAGGASVTKTTTVYFMRDTKIAATVTPSTGGTATVSGTLSSYNWNSSKWEALPSGMVHLYANATTANAETTTKGRFSIALSGLTAGATVPVYLTYGVTGESRRYGAALTILSFTAK